MTDLSVHVSDDPDDFRRLALEARQLLGGAFGECVDGPDQSYWDLHAQGATITIHREHYLGVSMLCIDEPHCVRLLRQYAEATGNYEPAWRKPAA